MNKDDFKYANRVRRVRLGAIALVCLGLVVGLQALGQRYAWRKDVTREQRYSLSEQTRGYVQALSAPVDITVVLSQTGQEELELVHRDLRWLMDALGYASRGDGRVRGRFVDPDYERHTVEALEERCGTNVESAVVVAQGQRVMKVPIYELYESDAQGVQAFNGEARLAQVLMELETAPARVIFTKGHGEMTLEETPGLRNASLLGKELVANAASVHMADLMQVPEVLETADLVIIAGPQVAFEPQEVEALRAYAQTGKLFIFLEALKPHGLEALLEDWSLESPLALIEEVQASHQTAEGDLLLQDFEAHPTVDLLKQHRLHILTGLTRPVFARTPPAGLSHWPLVLSSRSSFTRSVTRQGQELVFSKAPEHVGPLCVALWAQRAQNTQRPPAQLLLVGNADCISNGHLRGGNAVFAQQALKHSLQRPPLTGIPKKTIESFPLTLAQADLRHLAWALCALPALLGLFGGFVYWRRR